MLDFPLSLVILLDVRGEMSFVLEAPVAILALVRLLIIHELVHEADVAATGLRLGYICCHRCSGFGVLVCVHGLLFVRVF